MAPMKNAFARMSIGERADVKPDLEDEEMNLEEQVSIRRFSCLGKFADHRRLAFTS